jgi:hypothetical protein
METRPSIAWTPVTIDSSDAEELAALYAGLLSWQINARDGSGWVQVEDPHGGVGLNFQADDSYEPPTGPSSPDTRRR